MKLTDKQLKIIYGGVFLLLAASAILLMNRNYAQRRTAYEVKLIDEQRIAYDIIIEGLLETATIAYNTHINQPEILGLQHQALYGNEATRDEVRRRLLTELGSLYERLSKRDVQTLHFHLPNSDSFLRFHAPEIYGDSLKGVRTTVDLANATQTTIHGLESGRVAASFRNVFPLNYQGEHIGTVEISMYFQAIRDRLETIFPYDYNLIMRSDVAEASLFEDRQGIFVYSGLSDNYLFERDFDPGPMLAAVDAEIRPKIKARLQSAESFVMQANTPQANRTVVFLSLDDASGEHVAYLVAYLADDTLNAYQREYWFTMAATLLALGFVTMLLYVFHRSHRRLKVQSAQAEAGERRFHQIFDTNRAIKLIIDPADGQIVDANHAAAKFYGYTRQTLTTMTITQLNVLSPDDVTAAMALAKEEKRLFFDFRHRLASGQTRDVAVYSGPIDTPNGQLLYSIIQDVTDQRQAEKALKEQRDRLALTLKAADLGMWDWDVTSGHVTFETRWATMLGYEQSEIAPDFSGWQNLAHPDDVERVMAVLNAHLAGETPAYQTEHRMRTKWGDWKWILATGKVIEHAETGEPRRMVGIHQDITARKQNLAKLQWATDRLNRAEAIAMLGHWELDFQTDKLFWSNVIYDIFELDAHSFQPSYQAFLDVIHPQDRDMVDQAFTTAVANRAQYAIEHRLLMPDGRVKYVREFAQTDYTEDGQPRRSVGVVHDITLMKQNEIALAKTEARLRSLIDATPDIICFKDSQGRWLEANNAALRLFGLSKDNYRGKTDIELAALAIPVFQEVLRNLPLQDELTWTGGVVRRGEELFPMIDGTTRPYDIIKVPLFDDEGHRQSLLILGRDMSDRRSMETKLVQQERMAAVGQLAAGMAHDFNNILAGIIGYTELMLLSPDISSKTHNYLQQISTAGNRATHLVRQILDFSQKTLQRPRKVDLANLLQGYTDSFLNILPPEIELKTNIAPGNYPAKIDADQLRQAMINLVTNARDAIQDRGEITIHFEAVVLERALNCFICGQLFDGEWLRISIRDTGSGIPKSVQSRILEPFFTTKTVGQGTGLGLAQVSGIVGQHQGHIMLESELGRGTTFHIYLPPYEQNAPATTESIGGIMFGRGQTILVVEDELRVLETITGMLNHLGYKTLVATSGSEAIQVFTNALDSIDLVLSDMVMPEMSGEELLERLKALDPNLKSAMMSGYPLGEKATELLQQGVIDWFQKPITVSKLSHVIHKILTQAGRWG